MMIKNERQYRSAVASLHASEAAVGSVRAQADLLPEPARAAQMAAFVGTIDELRAAVADYEAVRDGTVAIEIHDVSDIPLALIKYRIRRGWTQRRLADELGAHEQQVQRWEEQEYRGVQFETIERVAHALDVPVFAGT